MKFSANDRAVQTHFAQQSHVEAESRRRAVQINFAQRG